MGRKCDWSQLQEKDLFRISQASPAFAETFGHHSGIFQLLNDGINRLGHPGAAFYAHYQYSHTPRIQAIKQEVEVISQDEIVYPEMFGQIPYIRINESTGSDPEIFVVRGKSKSTLLPAYKFLPPQEEIRKRLVRMSPKPGIGDYRLEQPSFPYRDGFAAECYVTPLSCHGYFINYLRQGLVSVLRAARNFDRTASLTIKNTFVIPDSTMEDASEEDAALGCTPSLNAYGDSPELPYDGRQFKMRFAGGHVHLGIRQQLENIPEVIKSIDVVAALPAVAAFASLDNPLRRQYYGRAGEYRVPSHGLEYRTLSNAWLVSGPVAHLFLSLCRAGLKVGVSKARKLFELPDEQVQEIINFCDVKTARKYVLDHLEAYQILLGADGVGGGEPNMKQSLEAIIGGGVEELYPDPDNLEGNWGLAEIWGGESNSGMETWRGLCRRLNTKTQIAMSK